MTTEEKKARVSALLAEVKRQGKSVRLHGDAAFGCAVAAGVPVTAKRDGDRLTLTLAEPVDVWVDRGEIEVFTRTANQAAD